uniref:Uncharacterized protein n=1 Tax=viral metagenome TaxID=1070528 RepID=A0A6M3LPT0_9ZZZZ
MTQTNFKEAFSIDAMIYAIKEVGPEVWQTPTDWIGRDDSATSGMLVKIHIPPPVQRATAHMVERLKGAYPEATLGDMEGWLYTFLSHFGLHAVIAGLANDNFSRQVEDKLKEIADG